MDGLVSGLVRAGRVRTEEVAAALRRVDRRQFVPLRRALYAYVDAAQPLGADGSVSTISSPTIHALVLERFVWPYLSRHPPGRAAAVLEVGCGSCASGVLHFVPQPCCRGAADGPSAAQAICCPALHR